MREERKDGVGITEIEGETKTKRHHPTVQIGRKRERERKILIEYRGYLLHLIL
jgi:hypothetical protein